MIVPKTEPYTLRLKYLAWSVSLLTITWLAVALLLPWPLRAQDSEGQPYSI